MIVVRVPEPAINGKAIGTTLPLLGFPSCLKKSTGAELGTTVLVLTLAIWVDFSYWQGNKRVSEQLVAL